MIDKPSRRVLLRPASSSSPRREGVTRRRKVPNSFVEARMKRLQMTRSRRCRRISRNPFLRFHSWHCLLRCRRPRMPARQFPTSAIGRARLAPEPTMPRARNMRRAMRSPRSAGRPRLLSCRHVPKVKTNGITSVARSPRSRHREASSTKPSSVGTFAKMPFNLDRKTGCVGEFPVAAGSRSSPIRFRDIPSCR